MCLFLFQAQSFSCGAREVNIFCVSFQSLLCYPHSSEDLYVQILTSLERSPEVKGQDSLWLMAMAHKDPAAAVNVLLEKYPAALPGFTCQVGTRVKSVVSY